MFDSGSLGLRTHMGVWFGSAVGFAEGVSAGNEGNGFLVIHRHAAECFAYVPGRSNRIGIAVGPFRVDVDKAHLHSAQRIIELAVTAIALVSQPGGLRSPVNVFFRLPDIRAPTGETEGL